MTFPSNRRVTYSAACICAFLLLSGAPITRAQQSGAATAQAQPQKLSASAIQIERTEIPETMVIPEDFRVATYENVILQVTKTGKFKQVFRTGDQRAKDVPDLVVLHMVSVAFKEGSQKQREVTTVSGATSMKVKVQFTDRNGKVLLEKEVEGKVRFMGENIRATYDFAKKVRKVVEESFT